MTAAIIGNLTELIRPLHLLKYCWWSNWKSSVETLSLRKSIQTEFDYGENLSRILVMTALSGMYSVTNPIISLFGLIYIGIKYYVDRHNLLLAYKASHLNTAVFTWACYGSRCYVRLAFLRQFKTDWLRLLEGLVFEKKNLYYREREREREKEKEPNLT